MTDANKGTWTSFLKSIATFSGDLSTLTAPSFILSGTSLLEYSSYWGEHPDYLSDISNAQDEEARMLAACKWYISTLKGQFSARHESAGGEKKPLNPVLGETFHGHWDSHTGTTRLVAEQVSHHPPISAYSITTPNGVVLQGHNGQKSGFSGRTITVKQVGHATLTVPVGSGTETYLITLPQLSLEGLFFGAPYAELMDKSYIVSTSGWIAEHDYSGRGWLSGAKNTMKTKIYPPEHFAKHKKPKYVIEGQWNEPSSLRVQNAGTEERKSLFDIKDHSSTAITVDENDLPYESRRLWSGVASALTKQDYETASKLKSAIESDQRKLRKDEAAQGKTWERRYFEWHDTIAEPVSALMHAISAHAHGTWTLKQVSAYGLPSSS